IMIDEATIGLTGVDLTGFHGGHDTECWRRLGAIERTVDTGDGPVRGTRFSVWAPNAQQVRLVGDFNGWNGEQTVLHRIEGSGVWATFLPGVTTGALYKFEILGADGVWRLKADPMARFCEPPPHNASIVYSSGYAWNDDAWLARRAEYRPHAEPMSVYEVHLGSWRRGWTDLQLAKELVEYVTWQGFTRGEYLPAG